MQEFFRSRKGLILCDLFACFLWGSAASFIQAGYEAFQIEGTGSVLIFAGLRFLLAGALILVWSGFQTGGFPAFTRKELPVILLISLGQTIGQYYCYYIGLLHTSANIATLISGLVSFVALALSAWVFHLEKATSRKLTACLLGFAGVAIANFQAGGFVFTWNGAGLELLAQFFAAFASVMMNKDVKPAKAISTCGWQFLFGGAVLSLIGVIMGGHMRFSWTGVVILLWLALVSAVAYALYSQLLTCHPVSTVSIFSCTIPLFGSMFALIMRHETEVLSWTSLIGLVLVIAGVVMINRPDKGPKSVKKKLARN